MHQCILDANSTQPLPFSTGHQLFENQLSNWISIHQLLVLLDFQQADIDTTNKKHANAFGTDEG